MITKFDEFIKEEFDYYKDHKPLEGMCGTTIKGVNYDFKVKDIIKFAKENYEVKDAKLSDVYKVSLFKKLYSKSPDKKASMEIDGEWVEGDKMTDEQWKKFQEEQQEIVMKSNLKYPILLTVDKKGKIKGVIDGNHRVLKAKILKHDFIKAYHIPEEDIVKNFSK